MPPILLSFFAYTSFAFMDVINKFIFSNYSFLSFFQYMLLLDLAIIIFLILYGMKLYKLDLSFFIAKEKKGILIRSCLSVINTLCSLLTIYYLPLHMFYALVFLQPICAVAFSVLFGLEKINKYKISFILLAFVGIMISIEFWSASYDNIKLLGIIGGIGIAISGALSGVVVKKYLTNENAITIAFYNILLSIIVAIVYLSFRMENPFNDMNFNLGILISLAGFFCSLGIIFFMKSYQKGAVQSIAILQYTQIVWGVLFGYMLFKDSPSLFSIIGILLIIIANIFNIKLGQKDNVNAK
jgi:drug/metabolite transporter (DMT)-like permease